MHNWQYVLFYNDNHNNQYKKLHCWNSTVLRVCTELFFLAANYFLVWVGSGLQRSLISLSLVKGKFLVCFSKAAINSINSNCGEAFSWKVYVCHIQCTLLGIIFSYLILKLVKYCNGFSKHETLQGGGCCAFSHWSCLFCLDILLRIFCFPEYFFLDYLC